jgi:AraC family transcriptional regulator of adaptative response/methylated-DNA-[protein]-cysteine methyltransferase
MSSFHKFSFINPIELFHRLAGQKIYTGQASSFYGDMFLLATAVDLLALCYPEDQREVGHLKKIFAKKYSLVSFFEDKEQIQQWGQKIREEKPLSFLLSGTPFQLKVWKYLSTLRSGETTTYGKIAQAIHHPKAVRAVGSAVGANPISLFLPCHRVLRKDNTLGGYRWGLPRKRKMLEAEGIAIESVTCSGNGGHLLPQAEPS